MLDLLVQEGHAEMLAMPCINAVLTCKWEASLKRIFYTRLLARAGAGVREKGGGSAPGSKEGRGAEGIRRRDATGIHAFWG